MLALNSFKLRRAGDVPLGNVVARHHGGAVPFDFALSVADADKQQGLLCFVRHPPRNSCVPTFFRSNAHCVDLGVPASAFWDPDPAGLREWSSPGETGSIVITADGLLIAGVIHGGFRDIRYWNIATGECVSAMTLYNSAPAVVLNWNLGLPGADGRICTLAQMGN